jgi:hypothetical protein
VLVCLLRLLLQARQPVHLSMTLDVSQLLLFGLLCASIHWLVARSEIARPLWSRARGVLGKLLACAGCSGFWLGGIVAGTGWAIPAQLYDDTLRDAWSIHAAMGALLGVVVTPVFEGILLWGLERSSILPDVTEEQDSDLTSVRSHTDRIDTPVDNPRRRA